MNIKSFQNVHNNAMGLGEAQGKLNQQLADIYRDKKVNADYLEWVTATHRDDSQGKIVQDKFAEQVKAVQKNINLANTQKLMLKGEITKEPLTQKVRLLRANKPLMNQGFVTEQDIKDKKYFFITTDITPAAEKSCDENVEKFMARHGYTKKQMLKALQNLK